MHSIESRPIFKKSQPPVNQGYIKPSRLWPKFFQDCIKLRYLKISPLALAVKCFLYLVPSPPPQISGSISPKHEDYV